MAAAPLFALPWEHDVAQAPAAAARRRRGKRKRGASDSADDSDTSSESEASLDSGLGTELPEGEEPGPVGPGCPPGTRLPPPPFPHRALPPPSPATTTTTGEPARRAALAALNPPLALDPALEYGGGPGPTPRRRAAAALTAALHGAVLAGDWARAGRALGLLLRSEVGGRGPDVRRRGLWALGAEVLLRREGQRPARAKGNDHGEAGAEGGEAEVWTAAGVAAARGFYANLALQFPEKPWHALGGRPTARHFHRASAALGVAWVYEQQRRLEARLGAGSVPEGRDAHVDAAMAGAAGPGESDADADEAMSGAEGAGERDAETRRGYAGIYRQALAVRAEMLAVGYPYNEDAELQRLGRDVERWLVDLKALGLPFTEESGQGDAAMDDADTVDGGDQSGRSSVRPPSPRMEDMQVSKD